MSPRFKPLVSASGQRIRRALAPFKAEATAMLVAARASMTTLPDRMDVSDAASKAEVAAFKRELREGLSAIRRDLGVVGGLAARGCVRTTGRVWRAVSVPVGACLGRSIASCRRVRDRVVARLLAPAFPDEPVAEGDDAGMFEVVDTHPAPLPSPTKPAVMVGSRSDRVAMVTQPGSPRHSPATVQEDEHTPPTHQAPPTLHDIVDIPGPHAGFEGKIDD